MGIKRLNKPTGEVASNKPESGDTVERIVRKAILVHSAPDGEVIVFESGDGPIEFDKARIQRIVKNQNSKIETLAKDYGGWEKMPIGAFPPILDQHADDSNDRIRGRLAAPYRFEILDVPGVGKNCACVVTEITFLGRSTVEKVNDGRIYHLSIGIDEETDTLGETSTVIEPAAAGAMLLSKVKKLKKKGAVKMALKNKKLKKASDARLKKLGAIKTEIEAGINRLVTIKSDVKLAKKEGEISGRLTKLMASKKLTPAEFKKMEIKKLAKLDDESLSTVLSAFESREPVILSGQKGSTEAPDFATIGKSLEKRQMKRLKSETRNALKRLGAKMKEDDGYEDEDHGKDHQMSGPKEEPVQPGKDGAAVPGEEEKALSGHLEEMKKHLSNKDFDSAMAVCKKMEGMGAKHLSGVEHSDVQSEDYKKSMEHVQGQVDELNTQMARFAGMVSELMDVEKDEGHDLEAGEDDEEEPEQEPKPGAKA